MPPTLGALAATLVLPFLAVPAFADDSENTWNSTAAGNSVYWVDRDSGDVTGLPADMEPEVPEVDGYYTTDCTGSDGDGWQVPDYHPVLRGGLPLAEYRLSIGIANSWYEVVAVHPGDCAPNWVINYPLRLRGVYQYPIAYDASNPAVSGLPADAVEFITYETAWTAADYTIPSNTPANSSGAAFANWNVYQGDTFYGTAEPGDALPFSAVFAAGQGWKLAPVFAGDPDPGTGGDDNGGDNPGDNGDNGDNGDDDDPSGDGTGDGTGDSGHVDGDDDDSGDESDNPGGSDAALRLKKYAVVKVPGATCDWPPTSMYDLLDKDRSEYGNSQKITFDPACVKEIPKGSVIEDGTEITWVYRVYNDGDEDFFPEGDPQITIHDDHEGTCVIETYPDQMPGHTWDLCGITGQPNMSPLGVEAVFPPPSRYYDGTTDADLPNLRLVGAQEGDDVTLDTANTVCKYDHKDASTSRIVTCRNFSLSGADADKYRLPDGYKVTVHNASIIPKPVEYHLDIVKYDDGRDWLTPSTYDAEFNGTWDGLVGQETLNATPEGTFTFDNLVLGPGHSVTGGAVNLADGTGKLSNYDVTITRSGELRYSSIIELTVNATSSNQAITLNRYFNTDNVIVQWNDTAVEGSNDETPL
ncbi:MAG: YDG domain-containing protein, partial [Propionibacteriaceae bacterium]|nr:YDG domain-containing protein [Propionibacteriaceae bacterium]